MKAFKRMALVLGSTATVLTLALSFYNSANLNDDAFMTAELDLNNKRLDELNGNIVIGRMAASTRSWESLEEVKQETEVQVKKLSFSQTKSVKKEIVEVEPAIKEDLELTLVSVDLGVREEGGTSKKLTSLIKDSFSGSARTGNGGFVEEVVVNLPDGRTIDIYSHRKMSSNVFEYTDGEGKTQSAIIYESGKDTFTVRLMDDSEYPGSKLTFKTNGETFNNNTNLNWGMNKQNLNTELAEGERLENNYNEELDNNEYVQDYDLKNNEALNEMPRDNFSFKFNS